MPSERETQGKDALPLFGNRAKFDTMVVPSQILPGVSSKFSFFSLCLHFSAITAIVLAGANDTIMNAFHVILHMAPNFVASRLQVPTLQTA